MEKISIINGSLGGRTGNTASLLKVARRALKGRAETEAIHLSEVTNASLIRECLKKSSGFIFATGTYWDSWGSPLQKFLEETTSWEGTNIWMGKPAAVIVTMHSVGGKGVLSRLQGVLTSLGCLIPPMSGIVYSMAGHLALQGEKSGFHDDLWSPGDIKIICNNLIAACAVDGKWRNWPVDSGDPARLWIV